MAANSNATRVFHANMHQLVALMRDPALQATLKLEFISETPSAMGMWYHFHHGVFFTSWGEKIMIGLMPISQSAVNVEISSECAAPTQILDWGKNRQNIEALFAYIVSNLARYNYAPTSPAAASAKKFCTRCGAQPDASAAFCTTCGTQQG